MRFFSVDVFPRFGQFDVGKHPSNALLISLNNIEATLDLIVSVRERDTYLKIEMVSHLFLLNKLMLQ